MKRSLLALALGAVLVSPALAACGGDNQAGGQSNPDSQVEQPPLPGQEQSGGRSQGPTPAPTP